MSNQIFPVRDRVLLEPIKNNNTTSSGIVVSDIDSTITAKVVAVGAGAKSRKGSILPMTVTVGDKVLLSKDSGLKVNIEGVDCLVVREKEILAMLD